MLVTVTYPTHPSAVRLSDEFTMDVPHETSLSLEEKAPGESYRREISNHPSQATPLAFYHHRRHHHRQWPPNHSQCTPSRSHPSPGSTDKPVAPQSRHRQKTLGKGRLRSQASFTSNSSRRRRSLTHTMLSMNSRYSGSGTSSGNGDANSHPRISLHSLPMVEGTR